MSAYSNTVNVFSSLLIAVIATPLCGQAKRDDFVSDASYVVGSYQPKVESRSAESMATAAQSFLDSLSDELRGKAMHDLRSAERQKWTNLPARNEKGTRLGDLDKQQVKAACDMMATLFSEHGYKKICDIMLADDQLLRGGRPRAGFGTEDFFIIIFGKPSPTEPWAFQIDGHHLGLNLAVQGDKLTISPSFIGTQPYQFKIGDYKSEPMGQETKLAHQLIASLTNEQRSAAIVKRRRDRIATGPGRDGRIPEAKGVSCKGFAEENKALLLKLVAQWVDFLPEKQAKARMKEIKEQLDQTRFAWYGPTSTGSDISYAIQGPGLIIEYACQDLGGNPIDHLHSVYRNPNNEYGGQLKK